MRSVAPQVDKQRRLACDTHCHTQRPQRQRRLTAPRDTTNDSEFSGVHLTPQISAPQEFAQPVTVFGPPGRLRPRSPEPPTQSGTRRVLSHWGARRAIIVVMKNRRSNGGRASEVDQTSTIVELKKYLKGRKLLAIVQILLSFLEGLVEAAILTMFARLALSVVNPDERSIFVPGIGDQSILFAILILLALITVRLASGLGKTYLASKLQFSLMRSLRHESLEAYSSSSWMSQSELDQGDVQQLIVSIPNGISAQFSGLILHVGHIAIMFAMLGYSMLTDARLTLVLIVMIALATVAFRPLRTITKKSAKKALLAQRNLSSGIAQLASVTFETQSLALLESASAPVHGTIEREADQSERLARLKGSVVPLFTTVTYLAVTLCIIVILRTDVANLDRTGPILLVVLRSLSYGTSVQQAASSLASLGPSLELLREKIDRLRIAKLNWGQEEFVGLRTLTIENLSFGYESNQELALRDVSLEISSGMHVGVVGRSGGGKSTLVRMMLGLLEPDSGQILVNGVPIFNYERNSWARSLGVVPQRAEIITGSIADNLRFFREGIEDSDLWSALALADLADEFEAMPDGLETEIGPGRRALSGGQQQRLAIARAFASRPDFVVMDEPTSSVDATSEAAITEALARIPAGVTLVIVSHRRHILKNCDVLITVDNGEISMIGSYDEVIGNSKNIRSS